MRRRIMDRLPLAIWLFNVLAAALSYFLDMMWAVLPLFLVLFCVWFPAVIRVRKWFREGKPLFRKRPPAWVLAAAVVSVMYTFVNFIACMVRMDEGRLFTGHPLVFTGISMYVLWPQPEEPDCDTAEGGAHD